MPTDLSGYPPEIAALLAEFNPEIEALMLRLERGAITVAAWQQEFERILAAYSQAAYLLGYGNPAAKVSPAVAAWLDEQFAYLAGFANVVQAAGGEYDPAWTARARMYGASTVSEYWEGKVGDLPLPAMPGQGTQCMCITTPESRVVTARGMIAISDVKVGDLVLTHRGRFQPVLSTTIRMSRPDHIQAWIISPTGARIGCTSDHRFLTPSGWKTIKSIDNSTSPIYIYTHEEILFYMRDFAGKPEYERAMRAMPFDLPLRKEKGLSGRGMYFLREKSKSERAMGESIPEKYYPRGDTLCIAEALENLQRSDHRFVQPDETRRASIYELPGRNWEDPLPVSLSMGLDQSQWSNPGWICAPSHQREQDGRLSGKPGTDESIQAQQIAFNRRTQKSNGRAFRANLYGEDENGGNAFLGMPAMRENFSELSQKRSYRPEILLEGVLPERTPLYDIEVAEDHSFVLENLITHNSNCKCSWRIEWLDRAKRDADCFWELSPAEHCQTCKIRHRDWYPVKVRGGQLV